MTIKKDRNDHDNKKIILKIRIFVFRYIQNLNKTLIDINVRKLLYLMENFNSVCLT